MSVYHFTFVSQSIHSSESFVHSSDLYFGDEERAKEDLVKIFNEIIHSECDLDFFGMDYANPPSLEQVGLKIEEYFGSRSSDVYVVEVVVRKQIIPQEK